MVPTLYKDQATVPPPAYHRAQGRQHPALHIDALSLVSTLHLLMLCRLAVRLAHRRCPPPLPAGPGGAPRTYSDETLLLIALLRTLWRSPTKICTTGCKPGLLWRWLVAYPLIATEGSALPPTWTVDELGKCTSIERFFGRVFLFFRLQRPPLCGWSAIVSQVALTYTATIIVALAAQEAGRPDLIRSPKRVLAHTWEGFEF
jgi:hypothetical protein